jgi:hypothetical protein
LERAKRFELSTPTLAICQKWLAVEAERTRLSLLWGDVEARLMKESEALLDALPSGPTPSVAAIIANLSVAERLIFEEDHPVVHDLILRSIRDLAAVCGAR